MYGSFIFALLSFKLKVNNMREHFLSGLFFVYLATRV